METVDKIHMGELVKRKAEELNLGASYLAERLNYHRQNVYDLYRRKNIDGPILVKISKALGYDFFQHYRRHIDPELENVQEAEEAYNRMPIEERIQRIVVDIERGRVTRIQHISDPEESTEQQLLQLRRLVGNLVDAFRDAGLKLPSSV